MNMAVDHQISATVIDSERAKGATLFAFLDHQLSDILTLFIYNVMFECGLTCNPTESFVECLKTPGAIPRT